LQTVRDAGPSDGQRVSRAVERAERNIIRCDRIIEELLDFTHTRDLEIHRIAIDRWLDQVLDEQAAPPGITVRRAFDLAGVKVPIDAERLRRVVINVFDNACQAMAEGEVGQSDDGQPGHSLSVRTRRTGGRVEIVFEDTGPGIQPDARDRIFEPLFSTKGFGVGLGLTVVKQVMTQHGGDVEIESEPGRGTRVCLWLPWDKVADGEKT
jgi:signal transduction histidine kinase